MAGRFLSQDFIDEVLQKNDIVSVISKYITLTRRGQNYWACCPFHMEKTPSFSVKEDGQFFKCFGCGESGNVISFIMKYENVDFFKAMEILAENAGMTMPEFSDDSEIIQQKKKRDRLLNLLKDTTEFYQKNLNSKFAVKHNEYIKKRGLNSEMLEKFKIGASLDYDALPQYLHSKGYSTEDMLDAGVVGKGDIDALYDFYGTRLIFPIFNGLGEVVGFSGRDISDNPEKAKYKNTPQTMLFNKSTLIYGYSFLRELKKKHMLDSIILVEGQMDVIACHQAGITNAVGCLGTAFTPIHAKDLSHLSSNIILCLDGDSAGANATYKALQVLRDANMNVSVVRLTGAKDPDEYIKKFGKDKFVDTISNAMNYMEFILIDLAKKYDLNKNNEKNDYINEALNYLSKLSTASEQEIYLGVLREIVNVPIDALRKTLSGVKEDVKPNFKHDEKVLNNNNFIQEAKTLILASLLFKKIPYDPQYDEMFSDNDEFRAPFEYVKERLVNNQNLNVSTLYSIFNITPNSVLDKTINYVFPDDSVFKKYFDESVKTLKMTILKNKKENLKEKLNTPSSLDEMYKIIEEIKNIDEQLKKFNS